MGKAIGRILVMMNDGKKGCFEAETGFYQPQSVDK
jgi:hypothetical protein